MGQKGSIWVSNLFSSVHSIVTDSSRLQDYATSNFHPFIAAASADGTCKITNALRGARRKKTGVSSFLLSSLWFVTLIIVN